MIGSAAADALDGYLKVEEEGRKSSFQTVGHVVSVNRRRRRMTLETLDGKTIQVGLPDALLVDACDAMRDGDVVSATMQDCVTDDGDAGRASLRELRRVPAKRDYVTMFEELWGTGRDIYAGVPRDERGLPDEGAGH